MAHEVWRDVVGFEGRYIVSNMGNVMSLPRRVKFGRNERLAEGRMLAQSIDHYGYFIVVLSDGASRRKIGKVHRLVAEAFIPNPGNLATVDHINGIKTDNNVENLRWCSSEDNVRYAWAMGLCNPVSPESIAALVVRTSRAVVRDDGKTFPSVTDAARALGVTDNAVQAVLHGRNKTCRGHTFKYVEGGDNATVDSRENCTDS